MFLGLLLTSLLAVESPELIPSDTTTARSYDLDEVVVSAFKTNKYNLMPVSCTALSARQLSNLQITGIKELTAVIPNFYMPDYGSRASCPVFVRGVGNKSDGTGIGFYVDGMPFYEPLSFDCDLGDVASVEVLRGPQGTLYGRNAIGGIVNISTRNPLEYQNTRVRLGYGRYNDLRTQISNYTKLSDKFGFTFGALYHHNDGAFRNSYLDEKVDKMNETEERIGLYYKPASSFRRLVSTNGLGITYTGPVVSFNSQTSFQYINSKQAIDQDFTINDKSFVENARHQNMVSQEFTLKSSNDSRYQWVIGAFGMMEHVDRTVDNYSPSAYSLSHTNYCVPTSSLALYHQSTYKIWRGLSATAGIRLDYEHAKTKYDNLKVTASPLPGDGYTLVNLSQMSSATGESFESSKDFTQVTPKFTLQYQTTEDNLYYASITRGYKPGGFNKSFSTADQRSYEPEYSWNYEVGASINLLNNLVTVSADLFYIDWRHMQITSTIAGVGNITTNAGHTDSKGAELNIVARPAKGLQFTANYGYTYARFLSYEKSATVSYTNNRLPMVPNHTLSVDANYTINPTGWLDRVMFNVGLRGLGRIYWAEDNLVSQDFYTTLNAKVAFTKGIVTWELWGKNLTDTNYMAYGFKSSSGNYAQAGKPLTFGTTIELNF